MRLFQIKEPKEVSGLTIHTIRDIKRTITKRIIKSEIIKAIEPFDKNLSK